MATKLLKKSKKKIKIPIILLTTKGEEEKFGKYCIKGAIAGKEFGSNKDNNMSLINDYEWLKNEFIKEVNR